MRFLRKDRNGGAWATQYLQDGIPGCPNATLFREEGVVGIHHLYGVDRLSIELTNWVVHPDGGSTCVMTDDEFRKQYRVPDTAKK